MRRADHAELVALFLPRNRADRNIGKKEWRDYAIRNFNIIVGMTMANDITAEALKELTASIKEVK